MADAGGERNFCFLLYALVHLLGRIAAYFRFISVFYSIRSDVRIFFCVLLN